MKYIFTFLLSERKKVSNTFRTMLIQIDFLSSDCNDRENAILNDHDILEEGEDVEEKNGIDETVLSVRPLSPKSSNYHELRNW